MLYLWLKAFHIIFVIAWFAGLFYIFRLFVYHVKHKDSAELRAVYEAMERKLIRVIMNPAMVLTFAFGIGMVALNSDLLQQEWMHWKLFGVVLLAGYHHLASITRKKFARGEFYLSEKSCRLINEIPTVLLFLIVIMVVVKPFQ